jgi:hypothetical protein
MYSHEPNETPGLATPISHGATLSDPDICPAGDVDYYAFSGNAGDLIVVPQFLSSPKARKSFFDFHHPSEYTVLLHFPDEGALWPR